MNLKKNKYIIFILILAILGLILNINFLNCNNNNNIDHKENDFNKYYMAQEILSLVENLNERQFNNFQSFRFNSKIISNSFDKFIVSNISNARNIYKIKCTAVINEIFSTFNDCVFVVLYIHKKDGKKHLLSVI